MTNIHKEQATYCLVIWKSLSQMSSQVKRATIHHAFKNSFWNFRWITFPQGQCCLPFKLLQWHEDSLLILEYACLLTPLPSKLLQTRMKLISLCIIFFVLFGGWRICYFYSVVFGVYGVYVLLRRGQGKKTMQDNTKNIAIQTNSNQCKAMQDNAKQDRHLEEKRQFEQTVCFLPFPSSPPTDLSCWEVFADWVHWAIPSNLRPCPHNPKPPFPLIHPYPMHATRPPLIWDVRPIPIPPNSSLSCACTSFWADAFFLN